MMQLLEGNTHGVRKRNRFPLEKTIPHPRLYSRKLQIFYVKGRSSDLSVHAGGLPVVMLQWLACRYAEDAVVLSFRYRSPGLQQRVLFRIRTGFPFSFRHEDGKPFAAQR